MNPSAAAPLTTPLEQRFTAELAQAELEPVRKRVQSELEPAAVKLRARLNPPPDAELRRSRFTVRNEPQALRELADRFFARIDLDTPGLEQAKALLALGRHAQALDAWRDQYLARLREPLKHGLPEHFGGDLDTASLLRRPDSARLEEAMRGCFSTPRAKAFVGEPGAIPWGDPGSDLRLEIQGQPWRPATRRHGHGDWSISLQRGPHPIQITFIDFRPKKPKPELWDNFPNPDIVWKGQAPALEVTGPGFPRAPLPEPWLQHAP